MRHATPVDLDRLEELLAGLWHAPRVAGAQAGLLLSGIKGVSSLPRRRRRTLRRRPARQRVRTRQGHQPRGTERFARTGAYSSTAALLMNNERWETVSERPGSGDGCVRPHIWSNQRDGWDVNSFMQGGLPLATQSRLKRYLPMKMSLSRVMALAAVPMLLLALGTGSASAQRAGGNPPPPKGFEADSASFVSARTGYVLGARGCSRLPCKARLKETVNGGRTWKSVPAPAVSLVPTYTPTPASAVSAVRFENARDGWLFAPALWATTDGGRTWRRMFLPGEVIALAVSDGVVFAVSEPVSGGLNQARLYRSKVGAAKWTLARGRAPPNAPSPG